MNSPLINFLAVLLEGRSVSRGVDEWHPGLVPQLRRSSIVIPHSVKSSAGSKNSPMLLLQHQQLGA